MVDWGRDMEQLADALGLETVRRGRALRRWPAHACRSPCTCPTVSPTACSPRRSARSIEDGFAKMLVMKDLKLVVKLRHLHHVIRWAYKSDVKKAKKDIGSFVEAMADDDASDADTFLADPAQREMFEANFTAGHGPGRGGRSTR